MTGFFLALCTLLSNILNPIILMLMIFELGLGVIVGWQLVRLRKEINRLNASGRKRNQKTLREGRGKLTTTFESITEKDWNDFDAFLGQYQRDLVTCNFFSLLIQIFPLLGILGTVAGLYIAINNGQDIYTGVKFALSSTVYGIMAAVIFKIADIIFTARFLNYIDDGIERFEKNYNVVSQEAQAERKNASSKPKRPASYPANAPAKKPAAPSEGAAVPAPASANAPAERLVSGPVSADVPPEKSSVSGLSPANAEASYDRPAPDRNVQDSAKTPIYLADDFEDDDSAIFPEPASLKKGQEEAKNVADKLAGWRKNQPAFAGKGTDSDSPEE